MPADTVFDYVAVTIASGGNLSGVADVGRALLVAVELPAAWDAATLSLQASSDGVTFGDLYETNGTEVTCPAAAGRVCVLTNRASLMGALRSVRCRSGTSGAAVNQTADRALRLWTKRAP